MQVIQIQKYIGTTDIFNIELISSEIIKAMLSGDDITLRTDDGFSYEENGLYTILDNLCNYWNYDKSKITLESNNWGEAHNQYNVKQSAYSIDFLAFNKEHVVKSWNKEKTYGLFLGRGSSERIYSIVKHQQFKYSNQGLTSFHHNFDDIPINQTVAKASKHTGLLIDELLKIKPYSDIDQLRSIPIISPYNSLSDVWTPTYEKIAIEIVCETTLWPTAFQITEKTLRPIYFQRPFLILGPKDYLKKLNSIGFKTFNDIIPWYYDRFERYIRIDNIFQILSDLIETQQFEVILRECHDDIIHNYNLLLELSTKHRQISRGLLKYYDN
jgi:hypothetical protein